MTGVDLQEVNVMHEDISVLFNNHFSDWGVLGNAGYGRMFTPRQKRKHKELLENEQKALHGDLLPHISSHEQSHDPTSIWRIGLEGSTVVSYATA